MVAVAAGSARVGSPWPHVVRTALSLAAAMGVGRFVYTAILPLMLREAGMSSQLGASLATANYIGYLAGAVLTTFVPNLIRSRLLFRTALVTMIATVALMPVTTNAGLWWALRLVCGVCSAVIFVIAMTALLTRMRGHRQHLTGFGFGGVGAGIALSGALVLVTKEIADWRAAWWGCAALALVFAVGAWTLTPERAPEPTQTPTASRQDLRPWFSALFASYSLDGVGYIIGGTFLVAAIDQAAPGWLGNGSWVLVGIAAAPSAVLWGWLAHRVSRPVLLVSALVIQGLGMALPAVAGGTVAAVVAAVLFGGTFLGVGLLTLAIGAHLRVPRAVAMLTAGYSVGQILGPLVVTPLLRHGYREALLVGFAIVLASAAAAGALRVRYPHHVGPKPGEALDELPAV